MRAEHPFRREATPARKDLTGPADQRLRMVEPTVLRTAVTFGLACGYVSDCSTSPHIRQTIALTEIWGAFGLAELAGDEAVRNVSPAANVGDRAGQTGKVVDDVVVALLGVGEGEAGVNLQGLTGGVAAVGLDEGVVDALGLSQVNRNA